MLRPCSNLIFLKNSFLGMKQLADEILLVVWKINSMDFLIL